MMRLLHRREQVGGEFMIADCVAPPGLSWFVATGPEACAAGNHVSARWAWEDRIPTGKRVFLPGRRHSFWEEGTPIARFDILKWEYLDSVIRSGIGWIRRADMSAPSFRWTSGRIGKSGRVSTARQEQPRFGRNGRGSVSMKLLQYIIESSDSRRLPMCIGTSSACGSGKDTLPC